MKKYLISFSYLNNYKKQNKKAYLEADNENLALDKFNDYFPAELYQFKKISEITDSTKIKLSKNLFII